MKLNLLIYTLLLCLFSCAVFLPTDVLAQKEGEKLELIIGPKSTKKELRKMKRVLRRAGAKMNVEYVERDINNRIKLIAVAVKDPNGNVNTCEMKGPMWKMRILLDKSAEAQKAFDIGGIPPFKKRTRFD